MFVPSCSFITECSCNEDLAMSMCPGHRRQAVLLLDLLESRHRLCIHYTWLPSCNKRLSQISLGCVALHFHFLAFLLVMWKVDSA
jgi:hypothetical protein